jgi:hypothetical protein
MDLGFFIPSSLTQDLTVSVTLFVGILRAGGGESILFNLLALLIRTCNN